MARRNNTVTFDALVAHQSDKHQVVMIRATAKEIQQIAQIDRLGREESGKLTGFQRPQIAGHISEIRRYLAQTDAVLPNALVVAFAGGAKLEAEGGARQACRRRQGWRTGACGRRAAAPSSALSVEANRLPGICGLPDLS